MLDELVTPSFQALALENAAVATQGLRFADRIVYAVTLALREERDAPADDPIPAAAAAAAVAALTSGLPLGTRAGQGRALDDEAAPDEAAVLAFVDRTLAFVQAGLDATPRAAH